MAATLGARSFPPWLMVAHLDAERIKRRHARVCHPSRSAGTELNHGRGEWDSGCECVVHLPRASGPACFPEKHVAAGIMAESHKTVLSLIERDAGACEGTMLAADKYECVIRDCEGVPRVLGGNECEV